MTEIINHKEFREKHLDKIFKDKAKNLPPFTSFGIDNEDRIHVINQWNALISNEINNIKERIKKLEEK